MEELVALFQSVFEEACRAGERGEEEREKGEEQQRKARHFNYRYKSKVQEGCSSIQAQVKFWSGVM